MTTKFQRKQIAKKILRFIENNLKACKIEIIKITYMFLTYIMYVRNIYVIFYNFNFTCFQVNINNFHVA